MKCQKNSFHFSRIEMEMVRDRDSRWWTINQLCYNRAQSDSFEKYQLHFFFLQIMFRAGFWWKLFRKGTLPPSPLSRAADLYNLRRCSRCSDNAKTMFRRCSNHATTMFTMLRANNVAWWPAWSPWLSRAPCRSYVRQSQGGQTHHHHHDNHQVREGRSDQFHCFMLCWQCWYSKYCSWK